MKQGMANQTEVAKDEPSELDREGRWPTDVGIYDLALWSQAQPIAQDPSFMAEVADANATGHRL
eukprot:7468651-Pyramimonas_sp.AAC.1